MSKDERTNLHQRLIQFHEELTALIAPFMENHRKAQVAAWFLFSALFGYGQLFFTLELMETLGPLGMEFVELAADMMGQMEN